MQNRLKRAGRFGFRSGFILPIINKFHVKSPATFCGESKFSLWKKWRSSQKTPLLVLPLESPTSFTQPIYCEAGWIFVCRMGRDCTLKSGQPVTGDTAMSAASWYSCTQNATDCATHASWSSSAICVSKARWLHARGWQSRRYRPINGGGFMGGLHA